LASTQQLSLCLFSFQKALQEQREEIETQLERDFQRELKADQTQFANELKSKLDAQDSALSSKWRAEIAQQITEMKNSFGEDRERRREKIGELMSKTVAMEQIFRWNSDYEFLARKVYSVSYFDFAHHHTVAHWSASARRGVWGGRMCR
jgi:exonuclease VII large subunit